MTARGLSPTLLLVLVAVLLAAVPASGREDNADAGWTVLEEVRRSLAATGTQVAPFTQTWIPAGFSSGETESGRLALLVPDCLRWDYREPFPKSFLICGDRAHAWNPEDGTGQRTRVVREEHPGLDLLLLPTEELEERYRIRLADDPGNTVTVTLEPLDPLPALTEAELVIDPESDRPVEVSWIDPEGNRTRFEIGAWSKPDQPDLFTPPLGVRWEDG